MSECVSMHVYACMLFSRKLDSLNDVGLWWVQCCCCRQIRTLHTMHTCLSQIFWSVVASTRVEDNRASKAVIRKRDLHVCQSGVSMCTGHFKRVFIVVCFVSLVFRTLQLFVFPFCFFGNKYERLHMYSYVYGWFP